MKGLAELDVPVAAAVNCIMQWGIGSRDLLAGQASG